MLYDSILFPDFANLIIIWGIIMPLTTIRSNYRLQRLMTIRLA